MKRASYKQAIAFVADNDSPGDGNALDADEVQWLISAVLVADIFDVSNENVGKDIVAYRKKHHERHR